MQQSVMKAWWDSSHMAGGNATYIEQMYEAYLDDPQSVSEEWRGIFEQLPKLDGVEIETKHSIVREQFRSLASLGPAARAGSGPQQQAVSDEKQVKVLQLNKCFPL